MLAFRAIYSFTFHIQGAFPNNLTSPRGNYSAHCLVANSKSPYGARYARNKADFEFSEVAQLICIHSRENFCKSEKSSDFGPFDFQNVGL